MKNSQLTNNFDNLPKKYRFRNRSIAKLESGCLTAYIRAIPADAPFYDFDIIYCFFFFDQCESRFYCQCLVHYITILVAT